MKRIIINADDFGLSKSINQGIIKAYREGVLTSTSLMVNMPGFENAVDFLKDNSGLDVGLHINLFRGKPLIPFYEIKTLTDENGFFLQSVFKIVKKIYQKKLSLFELELECDAQMKKALDNGIKITHIDSEKHLHLLSYVYKIVVKLARKHGINKIRNINESPYIAKFMLDESRIINSSLCKALALQIFSMRIKKINYINCIKSTDYSFGLLESMTLNKYVRLFNYLEDGTTEILCHPGYIDEEWRRPPLNRERYHININRENELSALLSPVLQETIHKLNIEVINYKEL